MFEVCVGCAGIEDLMDEMDLEENIAVVAMGGGARVTQHLTNDLTLVREAIGRNIIRHFVLIISTVGHY